MWGSDYLHSESTFPHARKILEGVPNDEQAKIAGGNTARVYNFDVARLTPLLEELLARVRASAGLHFWGPMTHVRIYQIDKIYEYGIVAPISFVGLEELVELMSFWRRCIGSPKTAK